MSEIFFNSQSSQDLIWVEASAPSNIALIKYMGKSKELGQSDMLVNKPTNSSFSWTLNHLKTYVRVRFNPALEQDVWSPFVRSDLMPIELSEFGQNKFLNFFKLLKTEFKLKGYFEIESANNFPSDCGLASSASSFAALTKVTHLMATQYYGLSPYFPKELAKLSQKGSGSSCRSFFSPWSIWHAQGAEVMQLPIQELKHMVILCDESVKTVSSSQAHQKVLTSDLFLGRPERAQNRLTQLIQVFQSYKDKKNDTNSAIDFKKKWQSIFQICWNEFWDMHTLFHTSQPPFLYMTASCMQALQDILELWRAQEDGPIVTMDAGSNIHLLFRTDQTELNHLYLQKFHKNFNIWNETSYLKMENL